MTNVTEIYAPIFKAWSKALGSKPSVEMLTNAAGLNNRHGKQVLALAMALRPEGVTAGQIIIACGAPQNNKRRDMIEAALMRKVNVSKSPEGHTVYKVELTKKGEALIAKNAARAAALEAAGKVAAETVKVKKAAKGARAEKRAPGDFVAAAHKAADTAKAKREALVKKAAKGAPVETVQPVTVETAPAAIEPATVDATA